MDRATKPLRQLLLPQFLLEKEACGGLNWDNEAPQITIERMDEPAHCHEINTGEVVEQPWFHEIKKVSSD